MEKEKLLRFPLNIQLFGNGNEDVGSEDKPTQPITYSKEEYEKLKSSFDKTSSELAKMKKEASARLSEDEKKQKEQEEKDNRLKELELKVLTGDMANELMGSGLEKESISKIIETFKKGDMVDFCKVLSGEITKLVEKTQKTAETTFQMNATRPQVDNEKNDDGYIKSLLDKKNNQSNKSARDFYKI